MRFLALSFLITMLPGCYVSKLAWHQGKLISSRQKISSLLNNPNTSPELKEKLTYTQDVLAYAQSQGLNVDGAYAHYVELGSKDISYTVYAAYPDRLAARTWWFPIVGSVPYLGYFDKAERDTYAQQLRDEGYDVYESTVGAYSSLGWFDDPLYSTMLRRSKESLASVLFHELTHRTVWLKGNAEFNEQLASFVETYLTRKFLAERSLHENLRRYEDLLHDQQLFAQWIGDLSEELRKFYQKTASSEKPLDQTLFSRQKNAIFERFVTQLAPRFTRYKFLDDESWNNARVLANSSYLPDHQRFYASLQCTKATSIGAYLTLVKGAWQRRHKTSDPYAMIDQFCTPQEGSPYDSSAQDRSQ